MWCHCHTSKIIMSLHQHGCSMSLHGKRNYLRKNVCNTTQLGFCHRVLICQSSRQKNPQLQWQDLLLLPKSQTKLQLMCSKYLFSRYLDPQNLPKIHVSQGFSAALGNSLAWLGQLPFNPFSNPGIPNPRVSPYCRNAAKDLRRSPKKNHNHGETNVTKWQRLVGNFYQNITLRRDCY